MLKPISSTALAASKNDARCKSGQNNHLASLVLIRETLYL